MSSFEPMAAAIDWLDAYRAADLSIANLYAVDAAVECCDGHTTVVGHDAIAEYWRVRFAEKPAGELEALRADGETIVVSYAVPGDILTVALEFSQTGQSIRSRCRPLNDSP